MNIEVHLFDKAIGMRVVSANSNVIDVVLFRKVFVGNNKGGTIVGDDDVFENPIAKGGHSFALKFSLFRVGHERASTLNNVLKTA